MHELVSIPPNKQEEINIPSFTLRLEQGQDILLPDWSLHVTDDGSVRIIHELNTDLRYASTRASPAEDL